jgi:DNA-binding GntR family transcriptional regulator
MVDLAVISLGRDPGSSEMTMPKYEAFAESVRQRIRSGVFKPGQELPSNTGFQAEGWKRTTIMLGMRVLRSQGWVRGQPGEAVFVADNPPIGGTPGA